MTTSGKLMTEWLCHPRAESFIEQCIATLPAACAWQADLAFTNTRLIDWLDHLALANSAVLQDKLAELGFVPEQGSLVPEQGSLVPEQGSLVPEQGSLVPEQGSLVPEQGDFETEDVTTETNDTVYYHPYALLPRVLLRDGTGAAPGDIVALAVRVEDAGQFIQTRQVQATIEGTPFGPYRRARVWHRDGCEFLVVERRGHQGFIPVEAPPDYPLRYLHAFELWSSRPRQFDDARRAIAQALPLARALVSELGGNLAAWVVLAAERDYWQRHSQAQAQRALREDRLGMGWVNRSHYTFRISRDVFGALAQLLETLGFAPHGRFHAGAQVGWGAQVLQQTACRVTVCVDLDTSNTEGELKLWCTLHGESMLIAGLRHLAGRFAPLSKDLAEPGELLAGWDVEIVNPFATLRQALAQEQAWDVHASGRAN